MRIILYLIIPGLWLAGCGDVNLTTKDDTANTSSDETPETPEPSPSPVGSPTGEASCSGLKFTDKWFLSGQQSGFDKSQSAIPNGFRLPHRWEIVMAFDKEEFKELEAKGPYWTSTQSGENSIWVFDFSEGISLKFMKFQLALGIYIKDDFFPCKG